MLTWVDYYGSAGSTGRWRRPDFQRGVAAGFAGTACQAAACFGLYFAFDHRFLGAAWGPVFRRRSGDRGGVWFFRGPGRGGGGGTEGPRHQAETVPEFRHA